ncbi:MAG: hypothetical protein OEV35_09700, partial [Gallionellaceae bacterium]|nr:hypothetical protein [Gallionellaceae bacterium]
MAGLIQSGAMHRFTAQHHQMNLLIVIGFATFSNCLLRRKIAILRKARRATRELYSIMPALSLASTKPLCAQRTCTPKR